VEHRRFDLTELKRVDLSKRVTLCGSFARNLNDNNYNNRRNVNANNDWHNGSEMTLAYNLGILFLFLLISIF
jgi:hypothetical protein